MAMQQKVCVLMVALATLTVMAEPYGCPYCDRNLENRVNQIEAKMAITDSRSSAITGSFMQEMNKLQRDTEAEKATVTRLAEDTVQMKNNLKQLQGLDNQVTSLRRKVSEVKDVLTSNVNEVQGQVVAVSNNMQKEKQDQADRINQMTVNMDNNKVTLTIVQNKLNEQNNKLAALEQRLSTLNTNVQVSPVALSSVKASVDQLWQKYQETKDTTEEQVMALRNGLEELKRNIIDPYRG